LVDILLPKCDKCKEFYNYTKEVKISAGNVLTANYRILMSFIDEKLPKKAETYLLDKGDNNKKIVIQLCRNCRHIIEKQLLKRRR
jgi:hypothetical protein